MNPEAAVVPLRSLARPRAGAGAQTAPAPAEPKLTDLFAANRWVPKGRIDPELRKALGVIQVRLSETRRLLAAEQAEEVLEKDPCGQELRSLLGPDPSELDIDAAWSSPARSAASTCAFGTGSSSPRGWSTSARAPRRRGSGTAGTSTSR